MAIALLRYSVLRLLSTLSSQRPAAVLRRRPLLCVTTVAYCCVGTSVSFSTKITSNQPSLSVSGTKAINMMSQPQDQSSSSSWDTGYLNAQDAAALDVELMSTPGFSLEQLMELAGLSVAEAVYQVMQEKEKQQQQQQPEEELSKNNNKTKKKKILVVCGPGNNGGDGLVAARHLVMFGYDCTIVYPKESSKQHFINLVQQCHDVGIEIRSDMPPISTTPEENQENVEYVAIVDAIFGFSFHGAPREPFASIIQTMIDLQDRITTISVDIPSGWNVNTGDDENKSGFVPNVLISLTAPKLSAKTFKGQHFVGGRFVPPKLATKYNIRMPPYPGVAQVVQVSSPPSSLSGDPATASASWEEQYHEYCVEKEKQLNSNMQDTTPNKDDTSWEQEYHDYCIEKEKQLDAKEAQAKGNNNGDKKEKESSWEQQYQDYLNEKENNKK